MLHLYITALDQTHENESATFVSSVCSLLPADLHSELIFSLHLVLCRVAVVKRLPVHNHSVEYILFDLLGSIGLS